MTRSSFLIAILLHAGGLGVVCAVGGTGAPLDKPDARWIAVELAAETQPLSTVLPPRPQVAESESPSLPVVEVEPALSTTFDEPPIADGPLASDRLDSKFLSSTVQVVPHPHPPTAMPPVEAPVEAAAEPTAASSVDVDPSPLEAVNRPPVYPFTDWRRGHQGTVVLDLDIDARGIVVGARIATSSGWRGLDRAAREQLLTWRFQPARRDGHACATVFRQSVEFRIVSDAATPSVGIVGDGAVH